MSSKHQIENMDNSVCNTDELVAAAVEEEPFGNANGHKLSSMKEEGENNSDIGVITEASGTAKTVSKNAIRKKRRYEKCLAYRKANRKSVRSKKKEKQKLQSRVPEREYVSKKARKEETKQKLTAALVNAQPICIDVQYTSLLSEKELIHLARQLGRIYGSNRKTEKPFHIHIVNLPKDSKFFRLCCEKNDGFQNYLQSVTDYDVKTMFKEEEVLYLSPDATDEMTEFSSSAIYVIGGLVDETAKKRESLSYAIHCGLRTAKLPIDTYMKKAKGGIFNQVLAVNQVFDILLSLKNGCSWKQALCENIPARQGFIPK